jgi:6-phosphogluconolactonase
VRSRYPATTSTCSRSTRAATRSPSSPSRTTGSGSTQSLLGTAPAQVAFSPNGSELVVTEKGSRTLDTFAVATNQGAPCWLVVTTDGRFAYSANAGGATISGFSIAANDALTLLDPSGATAALGAGAHPLDEAVSADGSLSPLGEVGTLPAGAVGLASS